MFFNLYLQFCQNKITLTEITLKIKLKRTYVIKVTFKIIKGLTRVILCSFLLIQIKFLFKIKKRKS